MNVAVAGLDGTCCTMISILYQRVFDVLLCVFQLTMSCQFGCYLRRPLVSATLQATLWHIVACQVHFQQQNMSSLTS